MKKEDIMFVVGELAECRKNYNIKLLSAKKESTKKEHQEKINRLNSIIDYLLNKHRNKQ